MTSIARIVTPVIAVAICACLDAPAIAQRCYEIVWLESLGGEHSRAFALNNIGDAAGISQTADHPSGPNEYPRACVWIGNVPAFLTGTV